MEIVKDDEWGLYKNFSLEEMRCSETNICKMTHLFMRILQDIRDELGEPLIISSGYRDVSHSVERHKTEPGEHALGLAADIKIWGAPALRLIHCALNHGVERIGVSQKGEIASRFVHLGAGGHFDARFGKALWTY